MDFLYSCQYISIMIRISPAKLIYGDIRRYPQILRKELHPESLHWQCRLGRVKLDQDWLQQTSAHTVYSEVTPISALNQYAENLCEFGLRNPLQHLVPCQYYTYYSHERQ